MKKWVLITGASQGIGYEFTKLFAADGYQLVLVARDQVRLVQIADELGARHRVTVKVLAKDLSLPAAAQEIFDELQREQIPISILVNNAGFGFQGAFAHVEAQRHLDLIQVNVTSLVHLTHLFLKPMLDRHEGRVLNVASVAAFMPGPFMAMYYASKAFVYSFSNALANELAGSGVTVTALCPGLTRSQFHARAGASRPDNFLMMEADEVARIGYRALMAGKPAVISGWTNKLTVFISKIIPTRLMMHMLKKVNRTP
ncbi:MAG: short-chain dehydrogenase [Pedosphaera sp.]|nr:short-chain dehydrogenase [Pedosphaera sp.]